MLTLNVIYTVLAFLASLTLVWEKSSEFNDLIQEVSTALGPFCVFLVAYILMFFAAFYLFGQQQVGFNYYYKKNQDEIESGKLQFLTIQVCSTTAKPQLLQV